jgi:hypothetical protein
MIGCPFFVARRQAPKLLEPVDQPFHLVALPVERPVERSRPPLVLLVGNRDADASPPQIRPQLPAAVALVSHDALWPQPRPSSSWPLDRPLLHQLLKGGRLVALSRRQDKGYWLAAALDANVDLGAKAAFAPTERLGVWVPFFAPAACWWARITVAST